MRGEYSQKGIKKAEHSPHTDSLLYICCIYSMSASFRSAVRVSLTAEL